ncbi:hypothetical protein [Streptomyces pilosus]|uniref:Secreted protein n=1 Tax=Streptomyces pilosus TaxID=28893 RepID=A0A918BH11_9ACTN|nr:hypothetical protein [Streptomyces pilosus]GGQ64632.1 hypothetical protein GCM10010280_08970 [Streptomyces pilosus]GGV34272.1 hypothetical protein GCM10010261_02750 [Streptomyces pilosus]
MRTYQKAAVVMAMLGSVSFLGAGVSFAGDEPEVEINSSQTTSCAQDNSVQSLIAIDDINLAVGILGLGNAENKETNAVECASNLGLGGK